MEMARVAAIVAGWIEGPAGNAMLGISMAGKAPFVGTEIPADDVPEGERPPANETPLTKATKVWEATDPAWDVAVAMGI